MYLIIDGFVFRPRVFAVLGSAEKQKKNKKLEPPAGAMGIHIGIWWVPPYTRKAKTKK